MTMQRHVEATAQMNDGDAIRRVVREALEEKTFSPSALLGTIPRLSLRGVRTLVQMGLVELCVREHVASPEALVDAAMRAWGEGDAVDFPVGVDGKPTRFGRWWKALTKR
jgi:hypothetical protein